MKTIEVLEEYKLSKLLSDVESSCEEGCFLDTQLLNKDILFIRLEANRDLRIYEDEANVAILLTHKDKEVYGLIELDNDIFGMPHESFPEELVKMAIGKTKIIIDIDLDKKEK